ncbi:MAG: hypothetical protein D6805_06270 [Planctomycetota bacterium]|nr:MAG: hypothetical protein D6805_06270 [Planctomycetota bacterium]
MYVEETIKDKNPLLALKKDPYAHGILKEEDFQIEVFETNETQKYLLFKKKINGIIGYILFTEREVFSVEEMKKIYAQYKGIVAKLANNNFREVELVVICKKLNDEVLESIKEYNQKFSHRPPIRVILNEA